MKKHYLITALVALAMLYPYKETVTIEKNKIVNNYAFDGTLTFKDNPNERVFVGTNTCCKYWLEKDEQPDVVTLRTVRLGVLGYLFNLGTADVI